MRGFWGYTFFLGLFILITTSAHGQLNETGRYYYPEFNNQAESNLYFRLENNNFVKNNEYFGNYIQGYTLMGYTIQPTFMYYAGSRLRIKAGVHLLQFSGVSSFTEVLPVFSVHTKLTEKLDLIMGGLQGDVHHKLIEPIFNSEHQYTRPIENGFQFRYNGDKLWYDIWIDWEQFIFLGDSKPEKFTAGISSEYNLTPTNTDFKVSFPLQFIATHVGGQISNYSETSQTLTNLVSGIKLEQNTGKGFIRNVGLSAYIATYKDLANESGWHFHTGNAIYQTTNITYKYGEFMLGYWKAKNFIAPKGSHLFQSVSNRNETYYQKHRQLLTSKLSFNKTFMKQIKFSATLETYYDIDASQLDYSYGLNLVFTPNFFISKVSFD
ncbi:hypothetical protein E9993_17130 [Labilibacter sediminis]|nr:hypothetical protein E9993_17130 [Labilibacter sediminis]